MKTKCRFKYSVEMLRNGKWELEYRFYYSELKNDHIDLIDNPHKRNLTFLEEYKNELNLNVYE